MKIIIDAMGGDNAPLAIVEGAIQACRDFGVEIVLTGKEEEIGAVRHAAAGDHYPQLHPDH